MAHLQRSIRIAAPVQALFDFHADPRNIERVASAPAQAQLLPPYDVPLHLGSLVRLRVMIVGLLPQVVETEIVVCDPPHELTDEQRRGPFRAWRHRHLFREIEGGAELTDDVQYELPTGLAFRMIGREAMTRMMENLFERRQELTKVILEGA